MKKTLIMLLLAVSSLLMGQNKTIVTVHGEKIEHEPSMTIVERDAKYTLPGNAPSVGTKIFNTTTNCHEFYDGTGWYNFCWKGRLNPATGGTSLVNVNGYTCSTAESGTMTAGLAVSGVTQTITATVTMVGTYNITATANGVIFTGTGTFAGTGNQNIVLTAVGTPIAAGLHNFILSTTPGCNFSRTTQVALAADEIRGAAGKIWKDRNVGASRVATSSTDYEAYGYLYQWGRSSDGHQLINWTSATSGTPANAATGTASDNPDNALFIISGSDWGLTQSNVLWQGYEGTNNPCPSGFRVPTDAEWDAELTAASITNTTTAFEKLKLTTAGSRWNNDGSLYHQGIYGFYWSSTPNGGNANLCSFDINGRSCTNYPRAQGFAVRCIKD